MSKILITGSTGLVGSACVWLFKKKGWEVVELDNNMRAHFFGTPDKEIPNTIDIRDYEKLEAGFKEFGPFDAIIHGSETGEIGSRSYIHSRNFADAVIFILKNLPPHLHESEKADKPDRYNIAGDIQLDNLELAQMIARLMGKELKYKMVNFHNTRPGHDPHYGLNMEKLQKAGWKQPLTFEESLKNTIQWQSENPEWINTK